MTMTVEDAVAVFLVLGAQDRARQTRMPKHAKALLMEAMDVMEKRTFALVDQRGIIAQGATMVMAESVEAKDTSHHGGRAPEIGSTFDGRD